MIFFERTMLMARKGRDYELLIKILEGVNYPNSKIESPYYIVDPDTGEDRELDIAIIINNNSENPFIIDIECRGRRSVQDVKWIEELIVRKKRLPIDLIIAVTKSNFTKPAKIVAEKEGVLLRRTNEVDATLQSIVSSIIVKVTSFSYNPIIKSINAELFSPPVILTPQLLRNGEIITLEELTQEAFQQCNCLDKLSNLHYYNEVFVDCEYYPECVYVQNGKSEVLVKSIEYIFLIQFYVENLFFHKKIESIALFPSEESVTTLLEQYTAGVKMVANIVYDNLRRGFFEIDLSKHFYSGMIFRSVEVCSNNSDCCISGIRLRNENKFPAGTVIKTYGVRRATAKDGAR